MIAAVREGKLIAMEGDYDHIVNRGSLCVDFNSPRHPRSRSRLEAVGRIVVRVVSNALTSSPGGV
jgi:hypothetical protein